MYWIVAIALSVIAGLCSLLYIQRSEIGTLEEKLRASMSLVQEYEQTTAKLKTAYQEKVKQMECLSNRKSAREEAINENKDILNCPVPDKFNGLF